MKQSIGLLIATLTTMLSGCHLVMHESSSWAYCGADGYYECSGDSCFWRGPTCPADTPPGTPPGYLCEVHTDCAAGCYCGASGTCEEAGFCTADTDCGTGYVCNEARHSCEPPDVPATTPCETDASCAAGAYCDPASLTCTDSCTCTNDADARSQGFDYCDEARGTCLPGVDPQGDCVGAITCNFGRPTCPAGQVALIANGCYTGECKAIDACASAPACAALGSEQDCLANAACMVSYTGIDCRKPDNTPCQAGDTNCTCQSYVFASCSDKTTARAQVEFQGFTFDATALMLAD